MAATVAAGERELLERLGLFDPEWYQRTNPDVQRSGVDPFEHYLRVGERLGRRPAAGFDPDSYAAMYPDVTPAECSLLLHYFREGLPNGRIPGAVEDSCRTAALHYLRWIAHRPPPGDIARFYEVFDQELEQQFLGRVETAYSGDKPAVDTIRATVIMPVYNRAHLVGRAIESVLAQTHQNWELIVVDDGSTDDTANAVREYLADRRIKLHSIAHAGVSAARNAGLEQASGSMVFYLDSDNRWLPHHVRTLLTFCLATGSTAAYSALAVEAPDGKRIGYRGAPFDWDHCFRGNYIDLNAYCHSADAYREMGGFDPRLRRMVDWDLVLRYSRSRTPAYAPAVSCLYQSADPGHSSISSSQPYAYRRVVQARNAPDAPAAIGEALKLRFALKIPAPYAKRHEWGDFHFAEGLARSLARDGHSIRLDFLEQWEREDPRRDDVVIVLRGLSRYEPHPEHVNVLWNISHPDQVSYEEYEQFDIIYVASLSYPSLLQQCITKRVGTLLQCTDPERFNPALSGSPRGGALLFVGNSRKQFRPMVAWALEAGLDLQVHGTRWDTFIDQRHIASEHIPNDELGRRYAEAAAVLNDHWKSMRDFGFVSNRIFDVLAAGGTVISDPLPSIGRIFGDAVPQVDSASALAGATAALPASSGDQQALSRYVAHAHSFDKRAQVIWTDVLHHLGLAPGPAAGTCQPFAEPADRILVGLLVQRGKRGPTSSGFIRLLAPLTTELAATRLDITILDSADDPGLAECHACIVQRVAVPTLSESRRLAGRLHELGIPLFIDTDDAFSELPETHPEREEYARKDEALRALMMTAQGVWFSTQQLASFYPEVASGTVVGNNLDPRLWRNYRAPTKPKRRTSDALQLLYMGTPTHDADFDVVLEALDRLWAEQPGSFALTLIKAVRKPPEREWIKRLAPPGHCVSYPRFARWLCQQGPFDAGLAPLAENPFNSAKSDVKVLDYAAMGLVSLVSDVPAYSTLPRDRGFVRHCPNTTEGWQEALSRLIEERGELHRLGTEAARYLWSERSVNATAMRLLQLIERDLPPPQLSRPKVADARAPAVRQSPSVAQ